MSHQCSSGEEYNDNTKEYEGKLENWKQMLGWRQISLIVESMLKSIPGSYTIPST